MSYAVPSTITVTAELLIPSLFTMFSAPGNSWQAVSA